jgi:hypothetical protein
MKGERIFQVVTLAILVGGGYAIYKRVKANSTADSQSNIDTIISSGNHSNRAFISTFQPEFLSAWASAIKSGQPTFVFNGKTIRTKGGATVKN